MKIQNILLTFRTVIHCFHFQSHHKNGLFCSMFLHIIATFVWFTCRNWISKTVNLVFRVCCRLCLTKLINDFGLHADTCQSPLDCEKLADFHDALVFLMQLHHKYSLVSMFLIVLLLSFSFLFLKRCIKRSKLKWIHLQFQQILALVNWTSLQWNLASISSHDIVYLSHFN